MTKIIYFCTKRKYSNFACSWNLVWNTQIIPGLQIFNRSMAKNTLKLYASFSYKNPAFHIRAVARQCSSPELSFANKTKTFFRAKNKRKKNHLTVKYRSLWPKFILRSKTHFPTEWHSSIKYYLRYKAKPLDCETQGVGRNTFLSSPHLCFIIVFICDLFVSRNDRLMS